MIAAALALLACAAPQQGAAASAVDPVSTADAARERLRELIAATNRLPAFRAEYVMQSGGEELGRVTLLYVAPDRLLMANRGEKGWVEVGINGEQLWMQSESPSAGALTGALARDDEGGTFGEALAVLAEHFPRPADEREVSVRFEWGLDPASDKTEFDLSLAYVRFGDERLLGWLYTMGRLEGELSLEGDALVHVSPRVRVEVDSGTGFLRRMQLVGSDGEERELSLVELDLEGPFDGDRFLRPEPAEGARDVSEPLRAQMFNPAALRTECLLRIDQELRKGRAWDAATQDGARLFLEALHRPVLVANVQRWKSGVLGGIDEFAAELDARRAAGEAEADLQAVVDERRAALLEGTASTLTRLREGLGGATRNPEPSPHWVDLRSLEDEVVGELFHEEVEEPLLAAFDERT